MVQFRLLGTSHFLPPQKALADINHQSFPNRKKVGINVSHENKSVKFL